MISTYKNCNNTCNCNKILVKVEACAKFSWVRVCKIGEISYTS